MSKQIQFQNKKKALWGAPDQDHHLDNLAAT